MKILDLVEFDPLLHRYENGNAIYTSVTELKARFMKEFDEKKAAEDYAAKHNLSYSDVLQKWKSDRIHGVTIHTEFNVANRLLNQLYKENNGNYRSAINSYRQLIDDFYSKNSFIYKVIDVFLRIIEDLTNYFEDNFYLHPETTIASHEYKVAGTIDLVVETTDKLFVFDYKTDKDLSATYTSDNMKCPFHHLADNKLNGYLIQLSMYKRLLELNNNNVDDKVNLIHIKSDEFEFDFEIKELKSYRSEAIDESFLLNKKKLNKELSTPF